MPAITARSTKAEILEALAAREQQIAQGPSWEQIGAKLTSVAQTVAREVPLLIRDTYNAGALTRQWVSGIVAELSRPVLRSKV